MPSREIEDFIARWSAASPSERVQAVEKAFARAQPAAVAEILQTLVTLGRAHRSGEGHFRP